MTDPISSGHRWMRPRCGRADRHRAGLAPIDVVEQTGSTNADLLARAAAGDDIDGAVLIAEHQTAGRGRHGRGWSATPRSQIAHVGRCRRRRRPERRHGAGCRWPPVWRWSTRWPRCCRDGVEAGLKWPNDVLAGAGKLAGILAEVAAPAPVVVIGLGLNVTEAAEEVTVADLAGRPRRHRRPHRARLVGGCCGTWPRASPPGGAARGADCGAGGRLPGPQPDVGTRVRAGLPGGTEVDGAAVRRRRSGPAASSTRKARRCRRSRLVTSCICAPKSHRVCGHGLPG